MAVSSALDERGRARAVQRVNPPAPFEDTAPGLSPRVATSFPSCLCPDVRVLR